MGKLEKQLGLEYTHKRTVFHPSFYTKFQKGLWTSAHGISTAYHNKVVRAACTRRMKKSAAITAATYVLVYFMFCLPLRFVNFFFAWPNLDEWASEGWMGITLPLELAMLVKLSFVIPHIYFVVVELFASDSYEAMFFETLSEQNPKLSAYLLEQERESYWSSVWRVTKRSIKMVGFGIILYILSLTPYIGYFVFPAASTYIHMRVVGREVAIVFGIL